MATTKDDDARGPVRTDKCAGCGAPFAGDQRYCLQCGARRGPLPQAIAAQIAALLRRRRPEPPPAPAEPPAADPEPAPSGFIPSPRAAAVAVMGMLALGVLLGSATSQVAQSAGLTSILLEVPSSAPVEEPAEVPVEEATSEPAPVEEATPSAAAYEPVAPEAEPIPETPVEEPELVPFNPEEEAEATEEAPPVKHVFLIVLGENGFEEAFGEASPAPYLSKTLPEKGELLKNYYAVAGGTLANEIALLSGQGPTLETTANCPNYGDVSPATESGEGQVEGSGCVYPASAETLAGQLAARELTWKAYVEEMENGASTGQAASCRHPELGTPDLNQAPVPGDAYETWRNPFVYFHSILDGTECASNDVGLEQLATDLGSAKKTPTLSYIVPDACHSGGEAPCEPQPEAAAPAEPQPEAAPAAPAEPQPEAAPAAPAETPTGIAGSEEFLRKVVPAIMASPAYKEGGLIAITSAEAPQSGEKADSSACCAYPEYLNVPPVETVEGTTPGTRATGGGGRVGMLLISPYVKPGSVNETDYNHFTLLLTLEELFELEKLGYAQEAALTPFDSSVFNYAEEEESTAAK